MFYYKAMYKYELAMAAGVSTAVVGRWCKAHKAQLAKFGVKARTKLLPPRAVRFLCDYYGISV